MKKRLAMGSVLIACAVASLFLVLPGRAEDDATITLGTSPEPPECSVPETDVTIFWSVTYGTTPDFVYYSLTGPDHEVIEEQTYPGTSGVDVTRTWTVPEDATVGAYWVHVEFWSREVGHEADANVVFLVCEGTPAEPGTWGRVKQQFRK